MSRIVDIAALLYDDISVAINDQHEVFMWGKCRERLILTPIRTPFSKIHDVFASFASPSVMHEPLDVQQVHQVHQAHQGEKPSITKCIMQAFDDPVRV